MKLKTTLLSLVLILFVTLSTQAQYDLKPEKGYSQNIGTTVFMLENLKTRITNSVKKLTPAQTDYLLVPDANRIGAMIFHLAATEKYYQVYTFENRDFNEAEKAKWGVALELGDLARVALVNQPISYYLNLWDDVRKETLRLLKTKDDKWFDALVKGSDMNNYFAWFHVMEHQSNHMGQIQMIKNRLPKE
jgi:penicillin-binding protein-related factor A (putative recombinase)